MNALSIHRPPNDVVARVSRPPLAPSPRSAFLKDVARRLQHVVELGDGAVAQAAREAQTAICKVSPWLQA